MEKSVYYAQIHAGNEGMDALRQFRKTCTVMERLKHTCSTLHISALRGWVHGAVHPGLALPDCHTLKTEWVRENAVAPCRSKCMKKHGEASDAALQMSSTVNPPRRAVDEDRALVERVWTPGEGSTPTATYSACDGLTQPVSQALLWQRLFLGMLLMMHQQLVCLSVTPK